jgi:STE24 endopeptidase
MPRSRGVRVAWVGVVVLLTAFVTMVVVFTPWDPLPGAEIHRAPVHEFFTDSEIARSNDFFDLVKWASWANVILGLVTAVLLGFTSLGRRLVDAVRSRVRRWWLQVVVLTLLVLLIARLVTLPGAMWIEHVSRDYGLSTQTWGEWFVDVGKSFAISSAITVVTLLLLIGLARRFTRTWFVPASIGAALLVIGLSFAYPVLVEPAFNKFTPLPDGPLRTDLLSLAAESNVVVSDVLVADASRRTTALNAYVSGFGASKRIVIYDNLLDTASDREVELIVAHELGHASTDDVLVGTFEGAVAAALGVVALFLVLRPPLLRRPTGAGSMGDPAIVPVVLGLVAIVGFLASPLHNELSRHIEARADVHSLDLTEDPDTFIAIQKKLATTNLSHLEPNPILSFWFSSHPPTLDRIGMAQAWERLHGD